MAMGKGAKVAIGCVVGVLVLAFGTAVVLFGVAWWARGKVKQATTELQRAADQQTKIQELQEKANRNTFTRPADGGLQEDRLAKFLAVRKGMFAIYKAHEADLDVLSKQNPQGMEAMRAMVKLASVVNELRMVQAQALVDQGMSVDEYRYLVETIYKGLWASAVLRETGGKSLSEASSEALERAAEETERSAQQAEQSGQSPEAVKALRESARQMREQARTARTEARKLEVPPATVELLRKHQDEIKKYSMAGLEFLGL